MSEETEDKFCKDVDVTEGQSSPNAMSTSIRIVMARTRRMSITSRIRISPPPSRVRSNPNDIRSRRSRRRRKMNS